MVGCEKMETKVLGSSLLLTFVTLGQSTPVSFEWGSPALGVSFVGLIDSLCD